MYASICHSCSAPSGDVGSSLEMTASLIIASCSIFHPNCHRLRGKWIFWWLKLWEQRQYVALGGTPMQMFSYSFWLLVSFSDKTKTDKHPVRQEAKHLAGEEWHRDTESEREEETETVIVDFHFVSHWECDWGVDLWPKTISLQLLIFCLPVADKIDRIHRYFMMLKISCY